MLGFISLVAIALGLWFIWPWLTKTARSVRDAIKDRRRRL